MLRMIIIAIFIALPLFYYLIYWIRYQFDHKDVELFDYINLKIFTIVIVVLFVLYMMFIAFKLQESSGENVKPAIYQDGKIITQ